MKITGILWILGLLSLVPFTSADAVDNFLNGLGLETFGVITTNNIPPLSLNSICSSTVVVGANSLGGYHATGYVKYVSTSNNIFRPIYNYQVYWYFSYDQPIRASEFGIAGGSPYLSSATVWADLYQGSFLLKYDESRSSYVFTCGQYYFDTWSFYFRAPTRFLSSRNYVIVLSGGYFNGVYGRAVESCRVLKRSLPNTVQTCDVISNNLCLVNDVRYCNGGYHGPSSTSILVTSSSQSPSFSPTSAIIESSVIASSVETISSIESSTVASSVVIISSAVSSSETFLSSGYISSSPIEVSSSFPVEVSSSTTEIISSATTEITSSSPIESSSSSPTEITSSSPTEITSPATSEMTSSSTEEITSLSPTEVTSSSTTEITSSSPAEVSSSSPIEISSSSLIETSSFTILTSKTTSSSSETINETKTTTSSILESSSAETSLEVSSELPSPSSESPSTTIIYTTIVLNDCEMYSSLLGMNETAVMQ